MRRVIASIGALALVVSFVAFGSGRAEALDVCNGQWNPVLRDITINQGLGTYTPLVRGKTTLARLFLSEPTCAPSGAEQITGATVTVTDGAQTLVDRLTTTPGSLGPNYPPIDSYLSAPTANGSANPIFKIPSLGSNDTNTLQTTLTFSFHVTYQYVAVTGATPTPQSVDFQFTPGSTTNLIQATLEPPAHALRVLVVPMGDASDLTSGAINMCREFPEARFSCTAINGQFADSGVQNGMQALSRVLPVSDGVGDLSSTTAGLRYRLLDANFIDIGPNGLQDMTSAASGGKFCDTGLQWAQPQGTATLSLSSQLTAFLNNWNSTKGNPHADRVVGIAWQGISGGVKDGCAEGMADVNGTAGWVRDFVDQTVTVKDALGNTTSAPDPSMTGATLSMELAHTMGSVPPAPAGTTDPRTKNDYHSTNTTADPNQTQRAYNTTLAQWMSSPVSSMHFSGDSTGYTNPTSGAVSQWNNNSVLYEQPDYLFLQCQLTPGMASPPCPATSTVGSVGPAGASPAYFVLSGYTDGKSASTTHIHSYFSATGEQTAQDPTSNYHLIERDGTGAIINSCGAVPAPGCVNNGDQRVPVRVLTSAHDADLSQTVTATYGTIDATLPADSNAVEFELWNGTPPAGSPSCVSTPQPGCLYARAIGDMPVMTTSSGSSQLGTDTKDFSNAPGQETVPAVAPNGRAVAWATAAGIVVQERDPSTNQPIGVLSTPIAGSDPAWQPNGSLIYASANGDIDSVTVDTSTPTPVFGSPQVIYNHLLQTPPPIGSTAASDPTASPDGSNVAIVVNGDVWKIDASRNPSNPVVCQLSTFQITSTCAPVTHDGNNLQLGDNSAPSWGGSGAGMIAYDHGADVWSLDPSASASNYNHVLRIANAGSPAWGGNLVAYAQGGNLWVADSTTEASDHTWNVLTQLTSTGADGSPSLTPNDGTIAFDRNVGTSAAPNHDIFVGSLTSSSKTIQFTATTTGDPKLLEADLFVECANTFEPIFAEVAPSSTTTNSATFTVTYDDRLGCPGGTVDAQVTNGYQRTALKAVHVIPPGNGTTAAPSPAIAAPTSGSIYFQYDPVILIGSSVQPTTGTNSQGLQTSWYVTGPTGSGYSNTLVATTSTFEFDAPVTNGKTGWVPGKYTVTETVKDPNTGLTGTASSSYTVLPDPNHLGVNVTVSFNPQTLYVPSNGNDVTITVKPQNQKLSSIDSKTVRIVQVGNTATSIPIDTANGTNGWVANSDGSYTAKFNRLAVSCAVLKTNLVGYYVPIVVAGSSTNGSTTIRGYDPKYPNTAPNTGTSC